MDDKKSSNPGLEMGKWAGHGSTHLYSQHWGWRQEDQELKGNLSYIAHLRYAWAMWEPVSKHETKTKKQVKGASQELEEMAL